MEWYKYTCDGILVSVIGLIGIIGDISFSTSYHHHCRCHRLFHHHHHCQETFVQCWFLWGRNWRIVSTRWRIKRSLPSLSYNMASISCVAFIDLVDPPMQSYSYNRFVRCFFGLLADLAALYLTLVSASLTHCHFRISAQRVTFETWDSSDIWSEWCLDKKKNREKRKIK